MYYVTGDGERPSQVYFSKEAACQSGEIYIDIFDGDGYIISSWMRKEDGTYTEDF